MHTFHTAIRGSHKPIGTLVMSGSPLVAEALACAGFDFLVLDAEHSLHSLPMLTSQVHAVKAAGNCLTVVRVPGHDPVQLKLFLDVVAPDALMFPMVDTKEQAEALVCASLYPPRGTRGFARMTRATRYNTITDYVPTAAERLCRIVQVETEEAMTNVVSIGTTEGVDSVFFGLGDLSVAMGLPSGLADPDFKAYVLDRLNQCVKVGIAVGAFMLPVEHAQWFLQAGGSYVSVGADLKSLMDTAHAQLSALR